MADAMEMGSASNETSQTQAPPTSHTIITSNDSGQASLSNESELSKRPRDVRLIHMILASMGVNAYQERVPLQLLDFCYRYTSSTLQDALHLTSDFAQSVSGTGRISNSNNDSNNISLQALRLSIAARMQYQFTPSLPKESMAELGAEKNKVALPPLGKDWGLRLPPERYCLTGVGFGLKDEWESDGEEDSIKTTDPIDTTMGEEDDPESDDDDEKMEDVFGDSREGN